MTNLSDQDHHRRRVLALIQDHFDTDPDLSAAHWFHPDDAQTVRLVEVNPQGPRLRQLYVFSFHPTPPQVPFRLQIADVHPDDWADILTGVIPLPEGRTLQPRLSFSRDDLPAVTSQHV
jgi:hypothetical protein